MPTCRAHGGEVSVLFGETTVTIHNRDRYVEQALNLRLHEFDTVIEAIRQVCAKKILLLLRDLYHFRSSNDFALHFAKTSIFSDSSACSAGYRHGVSSSAPVDLQRR
jgi:hypothetical protein